MGAPVENCILLSARGEKLYRECQENLGHYIDPEHPNDVSKLNKYCADLLPEIDKNPALIEVAAGYLVMALFKFIKFAKPKAFKALTGQEMNWLQINELIKIDPLAQNLVDYFVKNDAKLLIDAIVAIYCLQYNPEMMSKKGGRKIKPALIFTTNHADENEEQ